MAIESSQGNPELTQKIKDLTIKKNGLLRKMDTVKKFPDNLAIPGANGETITKNQALAEISAQVDALNNEIVNLSSQPIVPKAQAGFPTLSPLIPVEDPERTLEREREAKLPPLPPRTLSVSISYCQLRRGTSQTLTAAEPTQLPLPTSLPSHPFAHPQL